MKEIVLARGEVAFVDDIDADLSDLRWYADHMRGNLCYVARRTRGKKQYLHRIILERMVDKKLERGEVTDHINHNTLDNRRSNLRSTTQIGNERNMRKHRTHNNRPTSSEFKGVHWYRARGKWTASIYLNNSTKHLGYFKDELSAAHAYDRAALQSFGEFAETNF